MGVHEFQDHQDHRHRFRAVARPGCVSTATIQTLVEMYKLLPKAQQMESVIVHHAHGCSEELAVGGWTDAGWATRVDENLTGGFMLCLTSVRILDGDEVDTTMIYGASQRFRQECRFSLACEVQGLAGSRRIKIKTT